MMSFRGGGLRDFAIPVGTVWLLTDIAAGQWKRIDNEIVEFRPEGPPLVRFRPVLAVQTPGAIEELCLAYRHALDQEQVPPLLAIACLVLDFLCIHPFRDGNGRVSRLLTLSCPGVSRDMVRRVRREFQKAGKVECLGRSPGAPWRRKANTLERG
jgi:Fic/DOC family